MSTAEKIFTEWYEDELTEIRKCRRGVRPYEIEGTDEWQRLSVGQRTALQVFFNHVDGKPDNVGLLGKDMWDFFTGRTAAEIVGNADALKCLELFLGIE